MSATHPTGQMIIMGIPGPALSEGIRNLIRTIQPGGFILFSRNLKTPEQVFSLNAELRSLCDMPPVICIDQEGGRVARLSMIGETPVSAEALRKAGRVQWCRTHGEQMGRLLALFGFNLNLCPVLDYSPDDHADNSLRGRCYGATPEETVRNASAFLEGMQSHGVLGNIKHFPGYTHCASDPHGDLPLIPRSKEQILAEEITAFTPFFPEKAESIMMGHGHFPHWHKEPYPASLSRPIVTEFLREELGYTGLVMTDDIEMGAVADRFNTEQCTRLAVEAGEDMLLICHNPACVRIAADTLASLPESDTARALQSIDRFKEKLPPPPASFDSEAFAETSLAIATLRREVSATAG